VKTKPYKHQLKEFVEHRDDEARALFWSMRTGKTKTIIDLGCYNFQKGRVDGGLVSAPNGVHENWVRREIPAHSWDDVPCMAMAWSAKRSRRPGFDEEFEALLAFEGMAWFSFNVEALTVDARARKYIARFINARDLLFVADECDDYGTPSSQRTKAARALTKKTAMRRIMSGTPLEDSPLSAYSEFELLRPGALGFVSTGEVADRSYVSGFTHFKEKYADYKEARTANGHKYPVLKGYKNLDDLKARMAPFTSVVLRSDCEDMPKLVSTQRFYEPSAYQMERYLELYDNAIIQLKSGELTTFEGGARVLKMQQVLGGFFISPDGDVERLEGPNPRLDALAEEAAFALSTRGKFIVWARFREEIAMIVERLREDGMDVVEYRGGMSRNAKLEALDRFMDDDAVDGLVGQPAAGGRGLNMSRGKSILWYSYGPRARDRLQANERATVSGGEDIDLIDIVATNWMEDRIAGLIDWHVLESLESKHTRGEDMSRSGMVSYLAWAAGLPSSKTGAG